MSRTRRQGFSSRVASLSTVQPGGARGHCPPRQRRCPCRHGSRVASVNLQADPKNRGGCGNDCSTCHSCGGERCAGVCGLCFAAGQICCQGSYCVNPFTDPEICGGCSAGVPVHVCAAGETC